MSQFQSGKCLNKIPASCALFALLLASRFAEADYTFGGDADSSIIGNTSFGWAIVDDGTILVKDGSWTLGNQATGHGTLTVKDIGTVVTRAFKVVGFEGEGVINVLGGAQLSSNNSQVFLGWLPGSSGSLTVSGFDSLFISGGGIDIGAHGVGNLLVTKGGRLETSDLGSLFVGTTDPNLQSEVVVSGGEIECGGHMQIGSSNTPDGSGVMRICNGGSVVVPSASRRLTIQDTLEVTDPDSRLECKTIVITATGESNNSAQCFVRSGATMTVGGVLILETVDFESSGEKHTDLYIEGEGTTVSVGTDLKIESKFGGSQSDDITRVFVLDQAQLVVDERLLVYNRAGLICDGASVAIGGDLIFRTTWPSDEKLPFLAITLHQAGVEGIQVSGDLVFRNPGTYLSLPHNSELFVQAGDRFPLVDVGGQILTEGVLETLPRFSNFAEGDLVDIYNGINLFITYVGGDGNDIELYTLEEICFADVNEDGQTDFLDISAFISAFTAGESLADMNSDGYFDFIDISIFLSSFATGCK